MIVRVEIAGSHDARRTELQAKLTGVMNAKDQRRELIAVLKKFPDDVDVSVEST